MAKKDNCILTPEVNGKPSKLYSKLKDTINDRPLTNYIYAAYLQQGVAAQMDSMGYINKDSLGQHRAKDVMSFFDVATMQTEAADINRLAKRVGAVDSYNNLVDFDSATDALDLAIRINTNNKGAIAYVTQHSDKFNVNIIPRNANSQIRAATERAKKDVWDILKQSFNTIGIDLDNSNIDVELANANKGTEFASWMHNIRSTNNRYLSLKDIRGLLAISENSQQVQRLKQMFGTFDEVAQKIYDAYRVRGAVSSSQYMLIDATLDNCKRFNGLDINSITQQVNDVNQNTQASSESEIQRTLDDLHQKFKINNDEHIRLSNKIKSLSDAADEAVITLERQYKQLVASEGKFSSEAKDIKRVLNILMKEIASKRYYAGVLGFINEANKQIQNIQNELHNAPTPVNPWEKMRNTSRVLNKFKDLYSGYYHILNALSNIDNLIMDEIISTVDRQRVANEAKTMKSLLEKEKELIDGTDTSDGASQGLMIDLCTSVLGDNLSNGMATAQFVINAQFDSTIADRYLYSIGRMSNPMLSVIGTIIQDARHSYDEKIQNYSLRIRRANHKLRKAGYRSRFMYDEKGRIISDIDWDSYNEAYKRAYAAAKRMGLAGLRLEEYMLNWEEQNTMDRVVDYSNGRTERVPNDNYRKPFPQLSQAQLEYYNEMMAIKGELGSLLPNYAQNHYIPPQVRRSFLEAMGSAIRGKEGNVFKVVVRALMNKIRNIYTIREDDTDYARNGIINSNGLIMTSGTLGNTPFKQIPIFYINRLHDQSELIKDFSGAMQHLVQTALYFEAMNNVRDVIEFMGDYIMNSKGAASRNNKELAESVSDESISIIKKLWKFSKNSNTNAIIEGMLDYHLYGEKIKNPNKYTKALKSLLMYNSIRSLTVNVKGMISNAMVGMIQMIIEAGGGEFYNSKDLLLAIQKVVGDDTFKAPGRFFDFLTNNVNSKSVLLGQLFDPLNEASMTQGHKRYFSPLRKLLSVDLTFMGYGAGEHIIHYINMYAVLHHKKVKLNDKVISLYDLFKVGNKVDGNSELVWDKNATYIDEETEQELPVDEAYLEKVKDDIKYVNQTTHGSMNDLDKGLIHQYMVGKYIMNLRQWMIEHYSRRYRKKHWDANLKREVEGFYQTWWKHLKAITSNIFRFECDSALHWSEMDKHQKANVKRAWREITLLCCLYGLQFSLGSPADHKKEFWYRMWIYQIKRAIVDVQGSVPIGIPTELNTLINSPIAATNTVNALLYPFVGVGDIGTKIQRGKYKGRDKYFRNLEKYWLPFVKHFEQLLNMDEDQGVFQVLDKSNLQ